jgi:DNA polymerase-3 subunit delta'
MSLKNIKGQDRAVSILTNAMSGDRISHAYIFYGPEGVGKSLAAVNFAKALNCQDEASGGASRGSHALPVEACDVCVSCRKIDSGNHPDIFLFSPDEDGASIGIDKIRALIKDVALKPYEARYKVYMIDNAEYLTREAANAFLKTLEEPISRSVLILITKDLTNMLPTIISRSQIVKFDALGIDRTRRMLVEDYNMDEKTAQVLSSISSGRLGAALKYRDGDFLKKRDRIIAMLAANTFFDSDFDSVPKQDLEAYLDIALTWYGDIMMAKASPEQSAFVNIDRVEAILKEAKRLEFSSIDSMIKQIILTASFLDSNANPKLAMSVLSLASARNAR